MKIRSITTFIPKTDSTSLDAAAKLNEQAVEKFTTAGYEVQTSRLATIPFPLWLSKFDSDDVLQAVIELETVAASYGFDYISIGPALPEFLGSYSLVPKIIASTKNVFTSGLTTAGTNISMAAVHACADIIHQVAPLTPDGFSNLRFCASANVPSGAPFFPAAYHKPDCDISFALAMQAADTAVEAFQKADDLQNARQILIADLEEHGRILSAMAERLSNLASFGGIDFSLAPFPMDSESLGGALEILGIPALGVHGSLAAAAFLAETIDRATFDRTGFSGLMLPVLEDSILAKRAEEGVLTIKDLLLYSAVCGTGLDTVPLPGDTTSDELYAVLLDMTALAQRLDKPLTARLMPIPGKKAGDPTDYDFAYFANSRVMSVESLPLSGKLAGESNFELKPRHLVK